MDIIASDHAAAELGKRVNSILNIYGIKNRSSEPHNKNQNYAEREWRDIKRMVELILNHTDAPMMVWLLILEYVCLSETTWQENDSDGEHQSNGCWVTLRISPQC